MPLSFWTKRFASVALIAFVVIATAGILRGREPKQVAIDSAFWAVLAASIFVATRVYRSRRGEKCDLCKDTPESDFGHRRTK